MHSRGGHCAPSPHGPLHPWGPNRPTRCSHCSTSSESCTSSHAHRHVCIFPGHCVLKIGNEWGSLALNIVEHVPEVQIDLRRTSVRVEVARQGFGDRIHVPLHLLDYRKMPREWKGSFGRVVCIETVVVVIGEHGVLGCHDD